MKVGYARVSTAEQNLDLQVKALKEAGCERIFKDKGVSGSQRSRPQLEKSLNALDQGDVLVVWKLDRLGRSLSHLTHAVIAGLLTRGHLLNEWSSRSLERSITGTVGNSSNDI